MDSKWFGGTKEEYETQYFGFGAQTIKIAFRDMVKSNIRNSVKDAEKALTSKLKVSEEDNINLTRACEELNSLYINKSANSLEVLDNELEKMLSIPDGLLLPEDEVQSNQYTEDDIHRIKAEIASLQKRSERAAIMEAYLMSELEELKNSECLYDRALSAKDAHKFVVDKMKRENLVKLIDVESLLGTKEEGQSSVDEFCQKYS